MNRFSLASRRFAIGDVRTEKCEAHPRDGGGLDTQIIPSRITQKWYLPVTLRGGERTYGEVEP